MKPVLVLQHQSQDHPAYLATWLQREQVPLELRNTELGQAYPASIEGYGALAVLGGDHSANDERAALRQAEGLILQAIEQGVPVIGHCLGGQLMARALGGTVQASPQPEVGWHALDRAPAPEADAWFGEGPWPEVFQWHYEAFSLPPGAVALASSPACPVQAFTVGRHLAMQFHIELDAIKLDAWSHTLDADYRAAVQRHITVQTSAQMVHDAEARLRGQQALADQVYRRWLVGR